MRVRPGALFVVTTLLLASGAGAGVLPVAHPQVHVDAPFKLALPAATPGLGVACAPDDSPRWQAVFARPAEIPIHTAAPTSHEDLFRAAILDANAALRAAALARGADVRMRFACDPDGTIAVRPLTLSTSFESTTFWSLRADAAVAGLPRSGENILVFVEALPSSVCGGTPCGGLSEVPDDHRLLPDNLAIGGGFVSVVFTSGTNVLNVAILHEMTHAMGAVQHAAPHATGAFHCNDNLDVMCDPVGDGGPRQDPHIVCPGAPALFTAAYDCGGDDYFHPFPPAGSYLATRWNVASQLNPFLERVDVIALPTPPAAEPECAAPPGAPCAVVAGWSHTCYLLRGGNVRCHGENSDGRADPREKGDVRQLFAGGATTCFLLHDRTVECQGQEPYFGDEGREMRGDVAAVALGWRTCLLTILGNVECEGSVFHADGDAVGLALIGIGDPCALLASGNVRCASPDPSYSGGDAVAIAGLYGGFCVVLRSGNAECVGHGYGMQHYAGGDAVSITAGTAGKCVLLVGGHVTCDGWDASSAFDPYPVPGIVSVAAGDLHACMVHAGGLVHCQGWDVQGSTTDDDPPVPPV